MNFISGMILGLLLMGVPTAVIEQQTINSDITAAAHQYVVGHADGYWEGLTAGWNRGLKQGRLLGYQAGLKKVRVAAYVVITTCKNPRYYLVILTDGDIVMIDPTVEAERNYLEQIESHLPTLMRLEENSACA